MPIRNYPFTVIRPGDVPRPYLPVTLINPDAEKHLKVMALIDTGADECALPASFAPLLGVRSFLNHFILTVNYPKKIFSLKLPAK